MKKPTRVVFIDKKMYKKYGKLKEDHIKKSIKKAITNIKTNAFSGIQIPKKLIPKEYKQKYNLNNLWKYDLTSGWRLMYTIVAENEDELITAIIEWSSHKEYEKQ